ncbi:hypothetical protein L1987_19726 [Smallanthus sonchifolius]|uniref:Uncharacterized protein n=1 Tax=Smallanthus sonchifolius TaxID=185202 RepID=A0ACB9IST2_9ASTR|nr:hypothetical protein L1987_19726 [Smallanthus sonchifolius]
MKKMNVILRKCKSLSKQLSSRSLGSKSARHHHDVAGGGIIWNTNAISVYAADGNVNGNAGGSEEESHELVFVGSTRKRYVISSKYLSHPLVNALIEKSKTIDNGDVSVINCEVVLFDHLLWMIENADFNAGSDCLDELADLYSS